MKKLLIFTMLMLTTMVGVFSQSGSFGSTYAPSGGEVVIFGQHSFQNGSGTINAGIIATERSAPTGLFSWATGSSWVGASNNAFVDGYARTYGTGSFVFPIGDNNVYRPAAVSAASTTSPATAAYYGVSGTSAITSNIAGGNHPVLPNGGPFPTIAKATNIASVDNVEYWDINGATAANITLTWNAASNISTLTNNNLSSLTILGWDPTTSKWVSIPSTLNANQLLHTNSITAFTGTASDLTSGSITTNNSVVPDNYTVYTLGSLVTTFALTNSTVNITTPQNTAISGSASLQLLPINGALPYSYAATTITGVSTSSSKQGGSITIDATTGAYTYTPATGYIGNDTFYIKVCDASSVPVCNVAAYYVAVTGNGPAPGGCNMTATIGVNSLIQCVTNNSYQFTGNFTGGTAPYTYLWDLNDGTYATTKDVTHTYDTYGEHDVTFIVRDANGCEAHASTVQIYIGAKPSGSFAIYPNSGTGTGITFNSTSTIGNGWMTYHWDLGNGTTSTLSNPGPIYYAPGTYTVTMIVTGNVANGTACSDTVTKTLVVNADATICLPPATSIIASKDNVCLNASDKSVTFSNIGSNATSYIWDFGDGSATSTASSPAYTYTNTGNYIVSLKATNACGGSSTATKIITVSTLPATPAAISGANSVAVNSSITISSTTLGGTWSSSDESIAKVDANGSVKGIALGTATITYTINNGCGSASVTKVITVTAAIVPCTAPVASFWVNSESQCLLSNNVNNNFAFYNTSTGTTPAYTWNYGDGSAQTTGLNGNRVYTTAGTYTVTLTATACGVTSTATKTVTVKSSTSSITNLTVCPKDANFSWNGVTVNGAGTYVATLNNANTQGCDSIATLVLTLSSAPTTPAAITGTTSVLVNGTTTLSNATAGGVWSSSNSNVAIVTNQATGEIRGVSAGNAIITYTVTNSCNLSSSTSTQITVNAPAPCVPTSSTTTLTICTSATPTSWNGINGINVSGTYTATLTNAAGCDSTATLVLTVNSAPAQPAAISGSNSLVLGNTTILSSATAGGVWSSSNTSVATVNASSGVVTGVSVGTATITYTINNGCGSASRTQVVTVSAACVPTTSSTSVAVCSSALPYIWNGVSYYSAGTYSKTFVNGNATGCDSTATLVLTVNSAPAQPAAISGSNSIVVGNTTTLSSATTGGVWTSGNTAVATVNPSTGVVTGVATGSVTITYTVTNSCGSSSSNLLVTVNTACVTPVANFTVNNATQCISGNSFVFTNTTTGTVSGYTWNFGDGSSTVTSPTRTYAAAGTYTVTLNAASGCGGSSKSMSVTVLPSPVTPVISGTTGMIVGGTSTLSATPAGGVWSSSNSAVATVNPSTGVVTGVTAGNAIITYTVTTTCGTASATTAVSVNCNLQASFTINNASQCVTGNNFVYTSTVTGGVAPYTYAWNFHDGSVSTTANPTKVYANYGEGNVQLQVTDSRGCVATVTPKYEVVGAQPTASFSVIDNTGTGTSKTFISSSTIPAGSMSYAWNFGNGQTSTLVNPTIAFVPGNYTVTLVVTGNGGCTATATQSITQSITSSVNIYPNPVVGQVDVSFRSASVTPTTVQILDLSGRLIQTQTLIPAYTGQLVNATFDMGGLQSGSYVIKIMDQQNGVLATKNLLKQ